MKKNFVGPTLFSILLIFCSSAVFSQTEQITKGGTESDLEQIINTLNGLGTITVMGDFTIDSAITIPEGIELNFFKGNKFIIGSGVTITINGSIRAGLYQIFDNNNGVISGNPKIEFLYPQWFGAKTDGSDATTAIQKTIDLAIDLGLPVKFPQGTYKVNELHIDNDSKPVRIVGSLIDRANQEVGSTIQLKNNGVNRTLFHLGFDGTNQKPSKNISIEGINFITGITRTETTYAIRGGSHEANKWVQRVTIQNCTFRGFVYGIYLGGYSDGLLLSRLKFETVDRCIYVVNADGSRINNIVAEPFIDYVLYSWRSRGLVFWDAILRGDQREIANRLTIPFIIHGHKAGVVNYDGPVEIKNVHIETSNGVGIVADAPFTKFDNISYQLVQPHVQNAHTIQLLNRTIQPVNCSFTNFKIQRELDPETYVKDIYIGPNSGQYSKDLIESNHSDYQGCKPEGLIVENWSIEPRTDITDRNGDGRFSHSFMGTKLTSSDYSVVERSNYQTSEYFNVVSSQNGIREKAGAIQVTATGSQQSVKILKTLTPWEGTLKVLMYDIDNPNASKSQTYKVSAVHSNSSGNGGFKVFPIGDENSTNLSTTPVFHGPKTGNENFNTSIDFEFTGTSGSTYKLVFHYEGISKL